MTVVAANTAINVHGSGWPVFHPRLREAAVQISIALNGDAFAAAWDDCGTSRSIGNGHRGGLWTGFTVPSYHYRSGLLSSDRPLTTRCSQFVRRQSRISCGVTGNKVLISLTVPTASQCCQGDANETAASVHWCNYAITYQAVGRVSPTRLLPANKKITITENAPTGHQEEGYLVDDD